MRKPLSHYLSLPYPFTAVAETEGGYFVTFPHLPGCMTQVERPEEIGPMAEEIRELWLETAYDHGADIPLPSEPAEYSGKFVLRVPRSLHRTLAESAERDEVSLNRYLATLLARGDAQARVEARLDALGRLFDSSQDRSQRDLVAAQG